MTPTLTRDQAEAIAEKFVDTGGVAPNSGGSFGDALTVEAATAAIVEAVATHGRPRCATCVHWKPCEPKCDFDEMLAGGHCASEKVTDFAYPGQFAADALVYDSGDPKFMKVWTGPQFGCVHHQEKPA